MSLPVAPVTVIPAASIEEALRSGRQYLAGDLARPQALAHVHDAHIEMGISFYPDDTIDQAHLHTRAREFQLVLAGEVFILELATSRAHHLKTGDFYLIDTGVAYAQRASAGTKVVFFKSPGGDDKVPVDVHGAARAWQDAPRPRWRALCANAGNLCCAPSSV